MAALPFDLAAIRRTAEPALAVLVLSLTASWIANPDVLSANPAVEIAWFAADLAAPALLALSVLAGVLGHAVRVGDALLGSGERARPDDTSILQVALSLALGALVPPTLWGVAATLYVVVSDAGSVLLAPFVALVFGSAIGVLVLARTAVRRARPGSPRVPADPSAE